MPPETHPHRSSGHSNRCTPYSPCNSRHNPPNVYSNSNRDPNYGHPTQESPEAPGPGCRHPNPPRYCLNFSDGGCDTSSSTAPQAPPSAVPMSSRTQELETLTMEVDLLRAQEEEIQQLRQENMEMDARCQAQLEVIQHTNLPIIAKVCNGCGASRSGSDSWVLNGCGAARCKDCCGVGAQQQVCVVHPEFGSQDLHRVFFLHCFWHENRLLSEEVLDLACGHPICTSCLLSYMPGIEQTYKCRDVGCGRSYDYLAAVSSPRLQHEPMQRLTVRPPMGKF
ncbi:hypothetical protein BKA63DRAFT_526856 [Paraphoma chrysanthemicola]|nr:hypothetical protein BKA63DRAFT_526856 [Paraphoma chrysanthemicola]